MYSTRLTCGLNKFKSFSAPKFVRQIIIGKFIFCNERALISNLSLMVTKYSGKRIVFTSPRRLNAFTVLILYRKNKSYLTIRIERETVKTVNFMSGV